MKNGCPNASAGHAHEQRGTHAISEDQQEPSIGAALEVAPRFGLNPGEAKTVLSEVFAAAGNWRQTGRQLRLKAKTLDAYRSAFENPLMDEARRLLRS